MTPRTYAAGLRTVLGLAVPALGATAALPFVDPAGRVLLAVIAGVLAAEAARCGLVRPVLVADGEGVTIRRAFGAPTRLRWAEVEAVRARVTRRFVTTVRTLEIDAGDRLVVLPAYRLGADPQVAATDLRSLAGLPAEEDVSP